MAAGAGLTAAADASITQTLVGATAAPYTTPSTNGLYCALYSTQFTAATKAGATEFTTTGYSTYVREQMGAISPFGWTIAAYSSSVPGVVMTNTNTITFPTVPVGGATQTLFAVGFCSALTSGTIALFADLTSSLSVIVGAAVVFSNSPAGITFTTY